MRQPPGRPPIQRNAQDDFASVVSLTTGHAVNAVLADKSGQQLTSCTCAFNNT